MYNTKIRKILVSLKVQEKIFKKHKVSREHIESLFFDEPYYFKTRDGRYIAIGFVGEHITIVFDYNHGDADIITAYHSSKWQKRLYRKKTLK